MWSVDGRPGTGFDCGHLVLGRRGQLGGEPLLVVALSVVCGWCVGVVCVCVCVCVGVCRVCRVFTGLAPYGTHDTHTHNTHRAAVLHVGLVVRVLADVVKGPDGTTRRNAC